MLIFYIIIYLYLSFLQMYISTGVYGFVQNVDVKRNYGKNLLPENVDYVNMYFVMPNSVHF